MWNSNSIQVATMGLCFLKEDMAVLNESLTTQAIILSSISFSVARKPSLQAGKPLLKYRCRVVPLLQALSQPAVPVSSQQRKSSSGPKTPLGRHPWGPEVAQVAATPGPSLGAHCLGADPQFVALGEVPLSLCASVSIFVK